MVAVIIVIVVLAVTVLINVVMKRQGYSIPGKTAVRCSRGHIFRIVWIEGGSFKAIRLGPRTRLQYCPVGKHWAIIHPIKEQDLTSEDRKILDQQQQSTDRP